MIVRTLRLERGWSQEHLALLSGLNIRTIQRVERGQNAGLETLNSLAAVFEVDLSQLKQEPDMSQISINASRDGSMPNDQNSADMESRQSSYKTMEDQSSFFHIKNSPWRRREFIAQLMRYCLTIVFLFAVNFMTSPGYIWAWWPALGWGFAILLKGLNDWFLGSEQKNHKP